MAKAPRSVGMLPNSFQQRSQTVPLTQFLKALDPSNPTIPMSAAGLRNAKAQAIQATGLSPEQVNEIQQGKQR